MDDQFERKEIEETNLVKHFHKTIPAINFAKFLGT